MPGGRPGRPRSEGSEPYAELQDLARWFRRALADAGYESPNAVVRDELAHKNVVYGLCNGDRFVRERAALGLARALNADVEEAGRLWRLAKEAMDRAAEARIAARAPQLTSWSQLPKPLLAVRQLVTAQAKAVERLPYGLLGVEEPPLSAVYVRQQVRSAAESSPADREARGESPSARSPDGHAEQPRATAEVTLPAADVLARHEHLLLTGEPGAGKSTLSSHLAWTLARIWTREETSYDAPLSEPVVPVRVAARSLAGATGSWSETLCRSVASTLGSALVAEPPAELFAARIQGARWLVLVDGLDEIADPEARTAVIRTLAQHARDGSDYRFVVTSRPLPEAELAPLRSASMGAYTVEPFGQEELRDFAHRWFAAQHGTGEEAKAAAERFLTETADGRLRELVRNPLLATIAAVNATLAPAKPLPTSRLTLYEDFCERLLTRGLSERTARDELRRRWGDDEQRYAFHLRLESEKRQLLGELGRLRLEEEASLWKAAEDRIVSGGAPELPGWQVDLREFLSATGLLVAEDGDFRFLHHSFAEFIAAQSYAELIAPDFPDMEEWVRRALAGERQNLGVFVFCMWGAREGCDADVVADRLLLGGHERVLLAGQLMAEGVAFSEGRRGAVVGRLEALARNVSDADRRNRAFEALGALGGHPEVRMLLLELAGSEVVDGERRMGALEALATVDDPRETVTLLQRLLGSVYETLPRAARLACALGETARALVRERMTEMLVEPDVDWFESSFASEAAQVLGLVEETAQLARGVLADRLARPASLKRAAEAWLKSSGEAAVAEILQLAAQRPDSDQSGRLALAQAVESVGDPQEAARLAADVLQSPHSDGVELCSAAELCTRVGGHDVLEEVMAAVERTASDPGHFAFVPGKLLFTVALVDPFRVGERAPALLREQGSRAIGAGRSVAAWLKAKGPDSVSEVLSCVHGGRALDGGDLGDLAKALHDVGATSEADEIARLGLVVPNSFAPACREIVGVLLKTSREAVPQLLRDAWREVPALAGDENWLEGVLDALPLHEEATLDAVACELARELVALRGVSAKQEQRALLVILDLEGREAVDYVVNLATRRPSQRLARLSVRAVAKELAALGERDAALEVWRGEIREPRTHQYPTTELLTDLEEARATHEATTWLRDLLADPDLHPPRRLRLRQMLAWLSVHEGEIPATAPRQTAGSQPHTRS